MDRAVSRPGAARPPAEAVGPPPGTRGAACRSRCLPRRVRRRFGIVGEDQIDAVLDASGFRYSDDDRYGARSARELERNARRWRRAGKLVVLLPQALGPFRTPAVREPFLRALDAVDLVYARDARSEAHLRELAPGDERIRRAPDFTIALAGTCPPDLEALVGSGPFACLVPNDRMLERTAPEVAEGYVAFLRSCAHEVAALGLRPVLVLHETARDAPFVERLRRRARPGSAGRHRTRSARAQGHPRGGRDRGELALPRAGLRDVPGGPGRRDGLEPQVRDAAGRFRHAGAARRRPGRPGRAAGAIGGRRSMGRRVPR